MQASVSLSRPPDAVVWIKHVQLFSRPSLELRNDFGGRTGKKAAEEEEEEKKPPKIP